jgi:hypothetical protein
MFHERTTVGLDAHARLVVTEAVDWDTGRVFSQRLVPATDEVWPSPPSQGALAPDLVQQVPGKTERLAGHADGHSSTLLT